MVVVALGRTVRRRDHRVQDNVQDPLPREHLAVRVAVQHKGCARQGGGIDHANA